MNPKCSRCSKTVYPMEKLSCLDKAWHKGCFDCEVCHTKLTMKSYKGYDKKPYCNAHYPTTKFTAVKDTPENLRLKEQQKRQSNVQYQSGYRESLQQFTPVADNPESERAKRSQQQFSNASYQQQGSASTAGSKWEQEHAGQAPAQPSYHDEPRYRQPAPEPEPQQYEPEPQQHGGGSSGTPKYKALYDYTAADDDEVSFEEGDVALDVEVIDEGWITCTIERTGERGMVPSNYFEPM